MTEIINRIYNVSLNVGYEITKGAGHVKSGLLWLADGTSRCLCDMVDIEKGGLGKTLKFAIAAFKLAGLVYMTLFNDICEAFEGLYSLYQSASFIGATNDFIRFRDLTPGKFLLGISSYIYLFEFLKKMEVFPTSNGAGLSGLSDKMGGLKVNDFSSGSGIRSIPYLGDLILRPRECCFVIVSIFDIYDSLPRRKGSIKQFALDFCYQMTDICFLLRLTANLGRIVGLTLTPNKAYGKGTPFTKVLIFITFAAVLAKHLIECSRERKKASLNATAQVNDEENPAK